ncbi:MAG: hypothetical protein V8S98_11900 [Lachnospiraceae bacterium]
MAAAAGTETISGEVTWNNQTFTTPVKLTGDTTLTLKGDNKIECDVPLDLNNCNLTVKGTGTLTVVGNGRNDNRVCNGAIFDSVYKGTNSAQEPCPLRAALLRPAAAIIMPYPFIL